MFVSQSQVLGTSIFFLNFNLPSWYSGSVFNCFKLTENGLIDFLLGNYFEGIKRQLRLSRSDQHVNDVDNVNVVNVVNGTDALSTVSLRRKTALSYVRLGVHFV